MLVKKRSKVVVHKIRYFQTNGTGFETRVGQFLRGKNAVCFMLRNCHLLTKGRSAPALTPMYMVRITCLNRH